MKSNSKVIDSSYFNNILYLIFNFLENVLLKKQLLYLKNKKRFQYGSRKTHHTGSCLDVHFFMKLLSSTSITEEVVFERSFVCCTSLMMSLYACCAPSTSKGTPIGSIFSLLENKPPNVIAMGTVGDVFEKTTFSYSFPFFSNSSKTPSMAGMTTFDDPLPIVYTWWPSSSRP